MISVILLLLSCFVLIFMPGCGAETVTIVDYTERSVDVPLPAERIVSLSSSASEIVCALDAGDLIVGRGASSIFPPRLEEVTVVGKSSRTFDLELILELRPDLVIADTMLSEDDRRTMESVGIPVLEESFVDPSRVTAVVRDLGLVLGDEDRADDLAGFIEEYQDLIQERTAGLGEDEMPLVFLEREWTYHTTSKGTSSHNLVVMAGGRNIAAEESVEYPTVSPEWVVERDPDVIVRLAWTTTGEPFSEDELKGTWDEIVSRPELANVGAVRDGQVHVLSSKTNSGLRSIVGELYLAKWFHPQLFEDVDPESVHEDLIRKFYGLGLEEVYAYP
jgi:iron complex transport system substrate-binding protein